MKTKILLIISTLILLSACNKDDSIQRAPGDDEIEQPIDTCTVVTKLIANGPNYDTLCIGTEMGIISVVDDSSSITVTFEVISEDNWVFKATQLYIGPETEIPANKPGDPILGQFPFNDIHEPGVTIFSVGPVNIPNDDYVIAAHADVEKTISVTTYDSLCDYLPETADFIFTEKGPDSYLNIDVFKADWLNGTYQGWCIDREHTISDGNYYEDADVYCSNEPLPDSLLDHPENIDLINWIINNVFTGQASVCGGNYTWGDIQRAIWELIDDDSTNLYGLGEWSQCRADEIVNNALANGEGFEPECDTDYLGVILDAEDVQTVLISVPNTCNITLSVTSAWGYGQNGEYCDPDGADGISFSDSEYYGGSSWGWYFYGCE